jgi:hypothetical protein
MPAPINTWAIAYIVIALVIWIFYYIERRNVLTQVEIEDFDDIITNFYENPDFDDFILVYTNRDRLINHNGRPIKYWLWGVYLAQPDFFNESRKKVICAYMRDIERGLRRVKSRPTAELLDCVWMLYFATGDRQYADIVKEVANTCRDLSISNAAGLSYTSIMGDSPFEEEE